MCSFTCVQHVGLKICVCTCVCMCGAEDLCVCVHMCGAEDLCVCVCMCGVVDLSVCVCVCVGLKICSFGTHMTHWYVSRDTFACVTHLAPNAVGCNLL